MAAKKPLPDVFVDGARKGFNIACNNILPNILMAFVIIQILNVTGILKMLGVVFAPVMALFGLPGQAVMILAATVLSAGGGGGTAASLYASGILTTREVTIVMPAIFLMGGLVQYAGRILGTSGISSRHYPMMFAVAVVNAMIGMVIMRMLV